jgi:superkiller protein 3
MSLKQCLKEAKKCLEANEPDAALASVDEALALDPQNYYAHIFAGKAHQLRHDPQRAAQCFERATALEPDTLLGWKAYFQVARALDDIDLFLRVLAGYLERQIAQQVGVADTVKEAQNYLQRHDNPAWRERVLRASLPDGALGALTPATQPLFGGLALHNLTQLVELVQRRERQEVQRLVAKERVRLPRTMLPEHRAALSAVKWLVYRQLDLAALLEQLVSVCDDDGTRRHYEGVLLELKYDMLVAAPQKQRLQREVWRLAEGMVVVRHPSLLCWTVYFDWLDVKSLGDPLDLDTVMYFLKEFGALGLGMVVYAYVMSDFSPYDRKEVAQRLGRGAAAGAPAAAAAAASGDAELTALEADAGPAADSPAQTLAMLTEGYAKCATLVFASRIVCTYYIHVREYEEGLLKCRDAIRLLADLQRSTGVDLVHTREDVLCLLAIIYTYHEAPKNFGKALQLYDRILADNAANVRAIIGKGLILVEKNQLARARELLQAAVAAHPDNVDAVIELGWCQIKMGDSAGREALLAVLPRIGANRAETRAVVHWRIAASYSQDLDSAFEHLILSLKQSKTYAPAYTLLGVLYEHYGDKARAQKCFYRAFELDVGEIEAARHLVTDLAAKNEWEVAEVLSRRIITTERLRRMLFSDDRAVEDRAWPYRVLGCAALNRQEDDRAVEWFQTALRMTTMDVQCWLGLGEAYYNCGRFDAAAKVLRHTRGLQCDEDTLWVVEYMLGVVLSEMGLFDAAQLHLHAALARRPREECVVHALYECMIHHAAKLLAGGFFGRAMDLNVAAVAYLQQAVEINCRSQKLWKVVGDAIRIFNTVKERAHEVPRQQLVAIVLAVEVDENAFMRELGEVDRLGAARADHDAFGSVIGIHAAKAAVYAMPTKSNKLVRLMCYYNLGLAYLEAFKDCCEAAYRDAAVVALKHAIRLEGSNATYWVALGNSFSSTTPQIAQHCFIKATALETRDADIWTNLAALYLRYGDHELAEEAFLRALSVAPQQLQSWLGHALAAQAAGRPHDATRLFNHAYVVANGRSPLAQLLYGLSIITKRLHTGVDPRDIQAAQEFSVANFAMTTYLKYAPEDAVGLLVALIVSERCKDYDTGIEIGTRLARLWERQYEALETQLALLAFARAKTQLARLHLGVGHYNEALENAEFGLNLLEDDHLELVLSARITIGLAFFFNDQFDDALEQLKLILAKKSNSQRLVTLIAQMLYTYNTEESKQAALDELFAHIDEHGSSLLVVLTLGAILVVDDLDENFGAIRDELEGLPLNELIGDLIRIVPQLISEINRRIGSSADYTWQRNAVLFPHDFHVWQRLSAQMALKVATLPDTKLNAGDTSIAYMETGTLRAIQRSIMLYPENSLAQHALDQIIV